MKNKEEFIKIIDNKFYNYLIKNSLIPFTNVIERKEFLSRLYDNLMSNFLNYKPKPPRNYISIPKNKYVIRMVPTFQLGDYCIYYFSIKVIEDYIAENRVEGTYGGYKLGGKLRIKENSDFEPTFEISYNENSFNSFAWKQEYGEYKAKLQEHALKMGVDYNYAVVFDIANFYDCIRLDLLELKIKERINCNLFDDEIYLLFNFLKYWNSEFDKNKTIGIPQDEVGDCSRILANFYLQSYDSYVEGICNEKHAKFFRFADDQIIFTKSKQDAESIMYKLSHQLFIEGLNINTSKVKEFMTFQDFEDYFSFSIFDKLKFETQDVNGAFELFLNKKHNCKDFKASSVLKRLLHNKINLSLLDQQNRIRLISYLWDEDFLLQAPAHYLYQIYRLLRDDCEKNEYLSTLEAIARKTQFESFKINHQRFKIKIKTK